MSSIKLKKILPYVAAIAILLGFSAMYDYRASRRIKPPAEFTTKVQQAENEGNKIVIDNFITSQTITKSKSRFGFPVVCVSGYYETEVGSGDGEWCLKGFAKYYGLKVIDAETLDQLDNNMHMNGWQSYGEIASFQDLKTVVLSMNDRVASVNYVDGSGLIASISIARTDMNDTGALCTSRLCQLADGEKDEYAAIAEVFVYYETKPF